MPRKKREVLTHDVPQDTSLKKSDKRKKASDLRKSNGKDEVVSDTGVVETPSTLLPDVKVEKHGPGRPERETVRNVLGGVAMAQLNERRLERESKKGKVEKPQTAIFLCLDNFDLNIGGREYHGKIAKRIVVDIRDIKELQSRRLIHVNTQSE